MFPSDLILILNTALSLRPYRRMRQTYTADRRTLMNTNINPKAWN